MEVMLCSYREKIKQQMDGQHKFIIIAVHQVNCTKAAFMFPEN